MGSGSVVVPGRKKKKGRKGSGQYKDNQRLALSKPSPQMASAQPRLPLCRGGTVSEAVPSLRAAITIGCHTMPYLVIQCYTIPYHTLQYLVILCYAMPYHAISIDWVRTPHTPPYYE